MEYEKYQIIQDPDTKVWVIFQDVPVHGMQVVELAETAASAKEKVDGLLSGELIPMFYSPRRPGL